MLFYVEGNRYKNIRISDSSGKEICKFEQISKDRKNTRGHLQVDDKNKKLIGILKNKVKYPFIKWYEESKEEEK